MWCAWLLDSKESNSTQSDPAVRLVLIIVVAMLVVWLLPLIESGVDYANDQAKYEAGYKCSEHGCMTDEVDARVAYFTAVLAFVTAGLVAFTGALFIATYLLYKTTVVAVGKASADAVEAREQTSKLFAAERRPWVRVVSKATEVIGEGEGGVHFSVEVQLKNIGMTPAINTIAMLGKENEWDETVRARLMERMTASATVGPLVPRKLGVTLFPGQRHKRKSFFSFSEIPDYTSTRYLVGYVQYQFADDAAMHFTPMVWQVWLSRDAETKKIFNAMMVTPHFDNVPGPT